MTNQEEMITEHIDECNIRINVIRTYMKNVGSYSDQCKHNIDVFETAVHELEKQIPKTPDYEGNGYDSDGNMIYDTWVCPNCGEHYEVEYDKYDYCPTCGQAFDWSVKK